MSTYKRQRIVSFLITMFIAVLLLLNCVLNSVVDLFINLQRVLSKATFRAEKSLNSNKKLKQFPSQDAFGHFCCQ